MLALTTPARHVAGDQLGAIDVDEAVSAYLQRGRRPASRESLGEELRCVRKNINGLELAFARLAHDFAEASDPCWTRTRPPGSVRNAG